jgi:hypothetical protein
MKHFNCLIKMHKKNFSLELVGAFPQEKEFTISPTDALYRNLAEANDILYFPSFSAHELAAYSQDSDTFTKMQYQNSNVAKGEKPIDKAFISAVAYSNSIFFIPFLYPAIVKLNIKTGEISHYADYVDELMKRGNAAQEGFFVQPEVVGHIIWLVSFSSNTVVSFDMETGISTTYGVGKKGYKYNGICFDGEDFWLSPHVTTNTPVVKWNPITGAIKEISEIYKFGDTTFHQPEDLRHSWHQIIYAEGHVWLFPSFAQHVIKIDSNTNTVGIANEFESDCIEKIGSSQIRKFDLVAETDGMLYAYQEHSETFIEYDFDTKIRRESVIQYDAEILKKLKPIVESYFLPNADTNNSVYSCYYYENSVVNLVDFISHVASNSEGMEVKDCRSLPIKDTNMNMDGTIGNTIYTYLKGL